MTLSHTANRSCKLAVVTAAFLCAIAAASCSTSKLSSADLIVHNARIWTGDSTQRWAEAMAVSGGKILAVGSNGDIEKLQGDSSEVVDAGGKMIVPGMIDSHIHLVDGGFGLSSVQLRDVKTREDFIRRIAEFAKSLEPGTWITNGDWDHTNWGGEMPQAAWIDSVTRNNPVLVQRLDGHMALANSRAMQLAGVSAKTSEVDGGTIDRLPDGSPTGIFRDNAMGLISRHSTDPSDELKDRALEAAMNYVAKNGVTSVQALGSWDDLSVLQRAHKSNTLRTRIYAVVPLSTWKRLADTVKQRGRGDEFLRIGGLKGFVDGSLGSHTAAFHQPFDDAPSDSGLIITPLDRLYSSTSAADKEGLQVMVHAIGDRAIHEQLNIFERVARENGDKDRRFRIEHSQHIASQDIPRFGSLKVIASMQPYHAIDDGRWAEKVIGAERIKTTYAFRELIDTKAVLAFGSDWFVAPATPIEGIYAAVTRRTLDDRNPSGWVPEQKITVEEALRAYTSGAAYASFEEKVKGILKPGFLADFVILDQDITAIEPEKIRDVKVVETYVGGARVYSSKQ